MNKQELIKEYESIVKDDSLELCGCYNMADKNFMRKIYKSVLEDLEQLDEPQKPVVPQFVADWYEECKENLEYNIWSYIYNWETKEECDFKNWLDLGRNNPIQTLVNMHQFGYTVEKEKRYFVRLKHAGILNSLLKRTPKGEWWFGINSDDESQAHTRKELEEAGFEEVFNSPLFEVKEVEE